MEARDFVNKFFKLQTILGRAEERSIEDPFSFRHVRNKLHSRRSQSLRSNALCQWVTLSRVYPVGGNNLVHPLGAERIFNAGKCYKAS